MDGYDLRDQFAGFALVALHSIDGIGDELRSMDKEERAMWAYEMADEMVIARKQMPKIPPQS